MNKQGKLLPINPADRGRWFLSQVRTRLSYYTASHPRKQQS